MTIICFQLHYRPADIPHSSLCTMAKVVRRAMLPHIEEVFKKFLTEGMENQILPCKCALDNFSSCGLQVWKEIKSLIFSGLVQSML